MAPLPGYDGRFALRCWPDARRTGQPEEIVSDDLDGLKSQATALLNDSAFRLIDLAVWNFELNDWLVLESFEPAPEP